MLFRRTVSLFGVIIAATLIGWVWPAAHWPMRVWLPALLVSVFVIGPFLIALDIRDGREAKRQGAPEISGR